MIRLRTRLVRVIGCERNQNNEKMSLQWRLTIITTLFIAVICGCLTLFLYKNGVYYIDLLQDTVDAQSDEDNSEETDEIYINIPDDKMG